MISLVQEDRLVALEGGNDPLSGGTVVPNSVLCCYALRLFFIIPA